ncbi:TetR/AcrR family transcriptional regulator [Streptomyces sp. KN37]|uniref:TetR/AcrR family transcriptional regulator n=1 Tax=Streptomyces sp. KN37 TaxID=3090667 RepID=UPI002A75B432|nr:TetR/AcrR family transcriptional regulator [Streptomyces sp. KN37]WPO72834.1 TetR/AcrR family transcriptional regulator [Streptomyces sp. KN37]
MAGHADSERDKDSGRDRDGERDKDGAGAVDRKPPRKGTVEKRRAITSGARTVFGREGYTRASIDAIAAEAGASTRTIYNHFGDKEGLFRAVLLESAESVTAATEALFERHLRKVRDVEEDLLDFAREWVGQSEAHPGHFSVVRQIIPEGRRLPADVLEEWQRIGPQASQDALARWLLELGRQGLLAVDETNARKAARHLALMVGGGVTAESYFGALPLAEAEVEEIVRDGVGIFLRLYGVDAAGGPAGAGA